MLSRRNVRIKVMQMLYSMSRDQDLEFDNALKQFRDLIRRSYELYLFNLLQLIRIAEYSKEDKARKSAKLLPSEEDKNFTAKIAENPLLQSLINNEGLVKLFKLYRVREKNDPDQVRLFYYDFAKTEEYKQYLLKAGCTDEDHREILLNLYKHCIANEAFNELIEDNFPLWADDKSLVIGAIKKTIKSLPVSGEFYDDHRPASETIEEFGEELLRKVCRLDADLFNLIEPTLKNWDADRVAVIDMILLKMALCELMHFPTIPTKVTLNEFVEISKVYSTEKSKDFINGILDRLMKKLQKEGRINKEGRGLVE